MRSLLEVMITIQVLILFCKGFGIRGRQLSAMSVHRRLPIDNTIRMQPSTDGEKWKLTALPLCRGVEASLAYRFFETFQYNLSADKEISYKEEHQRCKNSDWCFREVNARYYNFNNIRAVWKYQKIPDDIHFRNIPDCMYRTTLTGVFRHHISLSFHILLEQFNCRSNITLHESGSTSFDVFAHNSLGLSKCKLFTEPNSNNLSYDYRCELSRSQNKQDNACLNLTVLLQYEHFDAYSEILASGAWDDYQYPPAGFPLIDNEALCLNVSDDVEHFEHIDEQFSSIEYISGSWVSGINSTSLFDHHPFFAAYNYF